jgi:cytidylate kinase
VPDIITIDGPAASGKSTIARKLAERLGFRYVNSGNYYRAYTCAIIRDGVDLADADRLKELLAHARIEERGDRLLLEGVDVSETIRGPRVTSLVSPVAKLPRVRDCVNDELRRVASRYNCVVEGRDIGTVVFPDACLKVFLVASIEERARRRQRDFEAMGVPSDFGELVQDIERRDGIDSTRETAPLKCSDDALVIDSTAVSIDGVVESIRAAFAHHRPSAIERPTTGRPSPDVVR